MRRLPPLLFCLLVLPSCHPPDEEPRRADPPPAEAEHHTADAVPIDCPLRRAGVNPDHLKPFEDVEKYIAFLEREDRAAWQKPDAVVAALGLRGDEVIADVGAGSGYFTFRLAKAVPLGRVVAIDIEPELVRHVHHKAISEGIDNVTAVLATPDDPGLPDGVDVVFVCDVLHHVADRAGWLGNISGKLAGGARLVLIEFKEGDLPAGPPAALKIPRAEMIALLTDAGLTLVEEQTGLLPYQDFFVFEKREADSR
jgi:SAM-dependent methyltransferase